MFKKGFTLLELMIVLVIIGLLATIGANYFGHAQEQTRGRAAVAAMRMIQAAERTFLFERNAFVACDDAVVGSECPGVLGLDIPSSGADWDYDVVVNNPVGGFTISANRNLPAGNRWAACQFQIINQNNPTVTFVAGAPSCALTNP